MEDQKHFHLVRYFTYVTAPLIIACIIIAALTHRTTMLDDLEKMGELGNVTLGQTLSNSYSQQLKSIQAFSLVERLNANQSDWIINDLLQKPIKDFLKNTPVVRVKIFTISGQTIYSTNNSQLHKINDLEQHAINSAKKGEIFSEMRMHPNFIKNDGSKEKLMIVNTYVPIYDKNTVIGVLELYNDITATHDKVQSGLHLFIAVLFVLGLLFFYTVIYFVQKAEQIIESKHESEIRDHEYLKIAFEKAKESTKVKSEFLASMSHELRTPLNAIIGYSELLLEESSESGNESNKKDLGHIKSAGIHLKTLIEEILDHAKIESGVIDIQTSDCNLREIIDSCIDYISPEINHNDNKIIIDVDKSIEKINTDTTKIKRILLNLLNNANKFTQQGTITITAAIKNGHVIVHVKDTGIGIPENKLQSIFEPFTQVDNSYTRKHGGTGLGLTISREYAEALNGKLSIISQEGKGTTLELQFPYCASQQQNKSIENQSNSPAA